LLGLSGPLDTVGTAFSGGPGGKIVDARHASFTMNWVSSRISLRRTLRSPGAVATLALMLLASTAARSALGQSVARIWNEQLLHAISMDTARPTVHARNLFHLSTAMYDAWAAYDGTATQYLQPDKLAADDVELARREAISYAAFRVIQHRFVTGPAGIGPGRVATDLDLRQQMFDLGYDPNFTSTVGNRPAALGNRIAQRMIDYGLSDGSREVQNYLSPPGQFLPVNQPLTFETPGTTMADPNRWQPLHFTGTQIDQFGSPIPEATQRNLTPFWGDVKTFAMTAADRSAHGVYHDQGPSPHLAGVGDQLFKDDAVTMIFLSAQLDPTDGVMIDVSPAARGNSPLGSYEQVGYAINPYTGAPYEPQIVKQADFGRVMAEFWADGPRSTAPPGHWNEIGNYVADRLDQLGLPKQIGGTGPVVNDLEYDVKRYFAENGALHDAAIAAWNHKGVYDSSRPISFIRYMGGLGQSTDPHLMADVGGSVLVNTYHPDGLPLVPGLIEVVTVETTAPGQRHQLLAGHEGEIAVRSWQGAVLGVAPFTDPTKFSGVDWVRAVSWMPYQLSSFVTPPFAGYVSGHSTYSRTAAEVLTLLTGSPYFPGGLGEYVIPQGSGLDFEYGPTEELLIQWATYFDASDQASLSRIYGGIHPPADDLAGRQIGHRVGPAAWAMALAYFNGTVVPEPTAAALILGAIACLASRCRGR